MLRWCRQTSSLVSLCPVAREIVYNKEYNQLKDNVALIAALAPKPGGPGLDPKYSSPSEAQHDENVSGPSSPRLRVKQTCMLSIWGKYGGLRIECAA